MINSFQIPFAERVKRYIARPFSGNTAELDKASLIACVPVIMHNWHMVRYDTGS
jgi:hypothetical protein